MKKHLLITAAALASLMLAKAQAPADVQAVDLGLPSGLKWASCNIGANAPEDYGNYFAWGETAPKADYSWATYMYANGAYNKLTKYCTDANYGDNGFTDGKTTLEPADDAAAANWGGEWRMPTDADWTELREQCTWTWTTQKEVNGYLVTSKTNGNSIFLPAAGNRNGADLYLKGTRGYYWSSSLLENYSDNVWIITFNHDEMYRHSRNRNNGQSVRPVQDKQEEEAESAYVAKPFTVAEGKQITFSGGNLQYTQSTQTWAFAEQQYDMLGTDNVDGGTEQTDTNFGYYYKDGTALADKIDLFGWSGSTGSAKWGVSTSTNKTDYSGDFVDWGKNTIGTDIPDTWRTLTKDEWGYLLSGRTNAYNLVGGARINLNADGSKYVNGLVLLPDNWTCPAGVTFKSGLAGTYSVQAYADYQTFTFSDWQLLESAGAVFLPASGSRYGASVFSVQYYGFYWSATPAASDEAYYMSFSSYSCFSKYGKGSLYGYAVRLVKNYSNVSTDLSHPSAADTAPARKVLRNGTVLIERNGKTYTLTGTEVK